MHSVPDMYPIMKSILRRLLIAGLAMWLTGCNFSLAADVTPPPGYKPPQIAASTPQPPSSPLYPLVPPDPAQGAAIYAEKCAPCHGVTGLGDGPQAADLPNPVTALGDPEISRQAVPAQWFQIVTQGNLQRFMPPFRSLSDRQRWDVVAYALSLAVSDTGGDLGAELYQANCARCHGSAGQGDGPDAIGMVVRDFTNQEYMAGKSAAALYEAITNGVGAGMPAYGEQLSEEQRWTLAEYLRSLAYARPTAQATPSQTQSASEMPLQPLTAAITATEVISAGPTLGQVSGFLMNGSGGEAPGGIRVTLHGFDQQHAQMGLVYSSTTQTDEQGNYIFENIEMPAGRSFFTTVDYKGTIYGSDLAVVEEGQSRLEIPIQIFEPTTDASILVIDRVHYFFEFLDERTLRVAELYIISNPSQQTLVAPAQGEAVLRFSLPPQASNLEFQEGALGGRFIQTEDGFGDTVPVRPGMGNYQVLFSYTLPYNRKIEISRPVTMNTSAIVVLTPQDGIKVRGETLQDAGGREVQGTQFHMYSGSAMKAGDTFTITISGQASSAQPTLSASSETSLVVGAGALGLVLIFAGVWLYRRNRSEDQPAAEIPTPAADRSGENPEALMDAILALDDLYQEGQLPEEAYLQRRDELKARLKEALG